MGDQNERIGLPRDDATWLTGDQVLELVGLDNPDNPGTPAAWIKGPAPLNYFYTFFAETLVDQSHHNTVHIMVVNTATVTGPMGAAMRRRALVHRRLACRGGGDRRRLKRDHRHRADGGGNGRRALVHRRLACRGGGDRRGLKRDQCTTRCDD